MTNSTINQIVQPKKRSKRRYLSAAEATARLPVGRPAGSKNKVTLFKEVIREGFEKILERDGMRVIEAVVDAAVGDLMYDKEGKPLLGVDGEHRRAKGDMAAAKLLLDRILPTTKAIDLDALENSKGISITVNIDNLEKPKYLDNVIEGEVIESN